jgi:hypothetical protein
MDGWYRTTAIAALGLAASLTSGACGSGVSGFGDDAPATTPTENGGMSSSGGGFGTGQTGNGGGADFAGDDASSIPALPPETKTESTYQSPVATGNVIWIANPTSGRVAYIDATTLDVETIVAGNGPTYLAAIPDPSDDVAIVLNALSSNATLLRRSPQGVLASTTFPSTANANSWAISSSGRWAVAWTNAALLPSANMAEGFQDLAVMDLSSATPSGSGRSTVLAVGYRPSLVAFSGDSRAFAVTQDGISVIDLTTSPPVTIAEYPLSAGTTGATSGGDGGSDAATGILGDGGTDAGDAGQPASYDSGAATVAVPPAATPDVSFTPDGTYALIRQDGLASITVVSLADGTLTTVPLPSAPTDLTLSPTGDFAVAVLRDTSTVALLPLPGIVSNPNGVTMIAIPGETIGRAIVTAAGKTVLLFTTASPISRLTVLTLQPQSFRTIELHEPVLAVFPTPDAKNAIVLNNVTPSGGINGAFSLVPLAGTLPANLVAVAAPPTSVAIAPTSDRAVISIRDDSSSTYGLDLALFPSLQVIQQSLASPPIATGIAAGAGRGYAAQDYSEGRITFIDLFAPDGGVPGLTRTITGFELGARIVDGRDQ